MAFGVSIIAQRRVLSGAPFSRSARAASMIAPGPSTLGKRMASGPAAAAAIRSVLAPRRVRPVDPDDDLAAAETALAHGRDDLCARRDLRVGRDRILKIEDQRVGGQRRRLGEAPWSWSRACKGRCDAGEQAWTIS